MNADLFDRLACAMVRQADRRQALRVFGLGLAAPLLVARSHAVASEPAAPVAPTTCQTDSECPSARGDPCAGTRCINHACTLMMVDCALGFVCCGNGVCCPTATSQAAGGSDANAVRSWRQTAGPYQLELAIGPPEAMYTPEQIATQHPTEGEVMLSGAMATPSAAGMAGMAMPDTTVATPTSIAAQAGTLRHLELHVTEAATGRVVTNAKVTIDVVDQTARRSTSLPVVTMQGMREGPADFHYGTAVRLIPGDAYAIDATVNGHAAVFAFRFDLTTPTPGSGATPPG